MSTLSPRILAVLALLCGASACSNRDAARPPSPPGSEGRPLAAPATTPAAVPPSSAAGAPKRPYLVLPPPAGPPKVIAEPMRPVPGREAASPRVAPPGTYWPENACVQFHTDNQITRWRWCVESVTLRADGEMVLRCVWELDRFLTDERVEKRTDEGNRNMYVVDGRGRRYDTVATTEFVKLGGELTKEAPAKRGDFVFRASGAVYSPLTFHDDDQKTAIAGIPLDPARRSDGVRRPRPGGEDVRTLLGSTRKADQVEILDTRAGLMRHGETAARDRHVLRREGSRSKEGVVVPASTLDRFLALLADAPVVDGPYRPRFDHTDDYPHLSMTIGTGGDPIVFFSDSQGADRVPWAVQFEGVRYVVPSDAPARALDLVRAYLVKGPTPVEPAAPARRPPAPPGQDRREIVAAAASGGVDTVRRLLAAGANPERGDDDSGETLLHFAAAGGHTQVVTLLIKAGARPDTPDHRGVPPLVVAAENGHGEVVRALLEHGARSGLDDALISASSAGGPDAARMLLKAGAAVDGRSAYGLTPLMHAAGGVPKPEVVRLLLDSGAAVNATDPNGRTALFIAAMSGTGRPRAPGAQTVEAAKEVVRMLLAAGADPQAKARQMGTVMEVLERMPPEAGASEMLAVLGEGARH